MNDAERIRPELQTHIPEKSPFKGGLLQSASL
jgi:hypothetical protein